MAGSKEVAVSLENLSHEYPARGKSPARKALSGVSLTVGSGEVFGLLGPNGGGKTTLFKILSTYFAPTSGRAVLLGLDAATQAASLRPRIGVVFQNPSLDRKLTVRENLVHQGRLYGLSGEALGKRVDGLLERYQLSARAGEFAEHLSGGMKRRVELAKGLLHKPEILILDEPSTGLDPGARKTLWDHLKELRALDAVTVLVTTHLMEEAERCDRLAIMDQGKVAALGSPDALKAEIGGDVISIDSPEPARLKADLKARFGAEADLVDCTLRLERREGHTFIPQLIEAFPGAVRSVSLGKPTLEDVFIHHTGRKFAPAEAVE